MLNQTCRQFKANPTPLSPLIFRQLAAHWEQRFNEDMERLHVLKPSTVTRVTEYVPEVVTFVEVRGPLKMTGDITAYNSS